MFHEWVHTPLNVGITDCSYYTRDHRIEVALLGFFRDIDRIIENRGILGNFEGEYFVVGALQ